MSTFIPRRAGLALLLLGGLAGVMAAGAAGAAASDNDPPRVVVKYSDLSLATDSGVNQLYRRIVYAAKRVCPDAPIRDFALMRQVEACRNQAVAGAVRQIDNSRLAALHASRTKNG
jgi:UrcA family protein